MTVVVGYVDPATERVHLAADTETSCGRPGAVKIRNEKLHEMRFGLDERVLFACAGRSALSKIVAAHLKLEAAPDPGDSADVQAWAQATAEAITDMCCDAGLKDSDGDLDGVFLLAWRGYLWEINHHIALRVESYAAIGGGDAAAMGAMYALAAFDLDPGHRVRTAAFAAIEHVTGITGPVSHLHT